MSDPVTNVEIEDVLSSIRRLVSENARAGANNAAREKAAEEAAGEAAQAGEDEAAGKAPGPFRLEAAMTALSSKPKARAKSSAASTQDAMLLLTPALRVRGEDDVEAEETAEAVQDNAPETGTEREFAAAVEDAVNEAVTEAVEESAESALREELGAGTSDAAPTFRHGEPVDTGEISALETRIAGLEAAVAERDDAWDPDGLSEDENTAEPVETLTWEDHIEIGDGTDELLDEAEDITPKPVSDAETVAPQARDAQAEAVEPQPEGTAAMRAEEPQHDSVSPEPDSAAHGAVPEPEATVVADEEDPDFAAYAEDEEGDVGLLPEESVIDEEVLREMVAEIVRQELQGSLGERITRNVRKLVRREIHRALTAQQLD